MRSLIATILALAMLVIMPVGAGAACTDQESIPPDSEIQQYFESVPNGCGAESLAEGNSINEDSVPSATETQLESAGPDGAAAVELAERGGPDPENDDRGDGSGPRDTSNASGNGSAGSSGEGSGGGGKAQGDGTDDGRVQRMRAGAASGSVSEDGSTLGGLGSALADGAGVGLLLPLILLGTAAAGVLYFRLSRR